MYSRNYTTNPSSNRGGGMSYIQRLIVVGALFLSGASYLVSQQVFEVNLKDASVDSFKVTVIPEHLTGVNNVFQFASTAPGTYQVMDIGRFVNDFRAYDKSGEAIPTNHSSTNQWT